MVRSLDTLVPKTKAIVVKLCCTLSVVVVEDRLAAVAALAHNSTANLATKVDTKDLSSNSSYSG